jgi:hypothetical protein
MINKKFYNIININNYYLINVKKIKENKLVIVLSFIIIDFVANKYHWPQSGDVPYYPYLS